MLGANPLEQVRFHATYNSSGNLPYVLGLIGVTFEAPLQRTVANALGLLGTSDPEQMRALRKYAGSRQEISRAVKGAASLPRLSSRR